MAIGIVLLLAVMVRGRLCSLTTGRGTDILCHWLMRRFARSARAGNAAPSATGDWGETRDCCFFLATA